MATAAQGPEDENHTADKGMHRVGARPEQHPELLEEVKEPLRLGAIWTHFAVADEDPEYTRAQIQRFREAVGSHPGPFHLANTAGALLFPDAHADLGRVGLGTYGLYPCAAAREAVDLRPAMQVVSDVAYFHRRAAGA